MADAGGVTLKSTQVGDKAKCPLLGNVDGSHTTLETVLDAMQTMAETIVVNSGTHDLSGSGSTDYFFLADQAYTAVSAKLVYTEASSSDAGVNVTAGKLIVGTDDADYLVEAVATEVSKEAGYTKALTLANTAVAAGDVLSFTDAGSKTGTGEVFLSVVLRKSA